MSIEDEVRAGAAEGARAGVLAALRSPEGREVLAGLIREAVAEVAPSGLRIAEFSRRSGLPQSTIRYLVKVGQLRARKIGRAVILDASQLRAIPENEIAAAAAAVRARAAR